MGLLDSMIGEVAGSLLGGGGAQGGAQGGGQGQMVQMLMGLLNQGGGQAGGLGGLLGKFSEAGLGDVAASWVGNGPNQPISPDQVHQALGSDTIGALASQLGLDHGQTAAQLSALLPEVINALTPNGTVPDGNTDLAGMATQLLGKFLQR